MVRDHKIKSIFSATTLRRHTLKTYIFRDTKCRNTIILEYLYQIDF